MPEGLTVVQHPVLDDRLAILRDAATPHGAFRQALSEASAILAVESTRDLPTVEHTIDTPLEPAPGRRLEAEITIVPVLRAGLGMVDGFLRLLAGRARRAPRACSATRTRSTPTGYYERLPPGMGEAYVFLLDPMLATGGSAVAALARLKANGARQLRADLPRRRARGRRRGARGAPRRADLDRGARPPARRERLHPTRPRGCRRPRLRHDGLRRRWPSAASRSPTTLRGWASRRQGRPRRTRWPSCRSAISSASSSRTSRSSAAGRRRSTMPSPRERIVKRGRGGYCFHLNGAFGLLLEALGYDVTPPAGHGPAGRRGARPPAQPPRACSCTGCRAPAHPEGTWWTEVGLADGPTVPLALRGPAVRTICTATPSSPHWSTPAAGACCRESGARSGIVDVDRAAPAAAEVAGCARAPVDLARVALRAHRHGPAPACGRSRRPARPRALHTSGARRHAHGAARRRGRVVRALADVFGLDLPDVDAAERRALWERVSAQHDAWAAQPDR